MSHGSTKAVITALVGNSLVTVVKFVGFFLSGSSALMAEAVHSLADTANQALLYLGLRRSSRGADSEHHFGYGQERYFWNLVSAITIFFLGCIYTIMHAASQLRDAHVPEISWIPFAIIGVAFLAEGYSFKVALAEFRSQAKDVDKSLRRYFIETRDPTTLAVLIEDGVAVLGLTLALAGMGMTAWSGSPLYDGLAAIAIGLLMGVLAIFLAAMNRKYLLNRSDDEVNEIAAAVWHENPQVQAVPRLNSIVLSPSDTLLLAEVELREEAIFADMSEAEITRAIEFMGKLDEIKRGLESSVSEVSDEVHHVFIEFVTPQKQPEKS